MAVNLSAMIEQYHGPLRSFLIQRCGNGDVAEELTQDTWVRVLQNPSRIPPTEDQFKPWIYRVAINIQIDWYRQQQVRKARSINMEDMPEWWNNLSTDQESAEDLTLKREHKAELARALADLPTDYRQALLLFAMGYTYDEIGAALGGRTRGAIKSLIHRARRRMIADCEQ